MSAASGQPHWFEPIADHLGDAYLRYSFTKGTRQEVDHLRRVLELGPGSRVLDVGCGPGRHARSLAEHGVRVHGVDISQTFIDIARDAAPAGATFEVADARDLGRREDLQGAFDAVICLCQGAFGLMTAEGEDDRVFAALASALVPGGRLALSAFNAYFAVRYHEDASFDAGSGLCHERTVIRDRDGVPRDAELWTGCYTPRELRLLARRHQLEVQSISSVEPGDYGEREPTTESPEFLLIARRPAC